MITIAYVGFGVSVREYHLPYVEGRNDLKVKYVCRRPQDIPAFAEYEPFYPEIAFTTDFDAVLGDGEADLVAVSAPDAFHVTYALQILNAGKLGRLVRLESHYDYYDLEFFYGNCKASVSTSMCVSIDYPRFTLHGANGSFTLPPVVHNSGKAKRVGRHTVRFDPAPRERWGTLVYWKDGERITEAFPVGCAYYEWIYDSLIDAIEHGGEKCVKDEEVVRVLEILEASTEVAKAWKK